MAENLRTLRLSSKKLFLLADTQLFVCPSVVPSGVIELKSGKTDISAPAHPSATGIGRVSGLAYKEKCMTNESMNQRPLLCYYTTIQRPWIYYYT